jgi:hypothetical protein
MPDGIEMAPKLTRQQWQPLSLSLALHCLLYPPLSRLEILFTLASSFYCCYNLLGSFWIHFYISSLLLFNFISG